VARTAAQNPPQPAGRPVGYLLRHFLRHRRRKRGDTNDRVNLIGNPYLPSGRSRSDESNKWFNTAAFAAGAAGADGTLGRNVLSGPGSKDVDLGLFRIFKIREKMQLQVRGELTNAFNFINLSAPTLTPSSAAFGTIRTASATRQVQLGLRLIF